MSQEKAGALMVGCSWIQYGYDVVSPLVPPTRGMRYSHHSESPAIFKLEYVITLLCDGKLLLSEDE